MDYHSLTRKELQFLCKKNKIRANMTNFAMADTLSSLPEVDGVEGNGNFKPETPLLTSTSRKSKTSATKYLSDLADNNEPMSSNGDLGRHTFSPLTNLYRSDISIPKVVHVVDHPQGTRLAKRLKLSAQEVGGRNDAINTKMLPGEEKNAEMRTKYELNDDVLPYNEGNRVNVSNEEQDEVGTGDVMVCAESLKLEEFAAHLNGDQDAIIEETSSTLIMSGVSGDKIGCSLNGCSSEVSYAPRVSAKKSLNTAHSFVGCTSDISSAPMVSKSVKVFCDLNETYLMGEETININDPNEDQDMESKDEPIQVNEPSLTVERTEILEASNLDNEKSKLMCDIELCNVKVTEVEAENSSNRNDDISGAAEKLSFSPSVTGLTANQIPVYVATPTRTTTSDGKVQGTTPLISYTTSIMGGVSRDKIDCFLNGCSSEVSYAPRVSAKKSLNTAHSFVGCTSDISSAPMVSKSVKVFCDLNETYLMGEETININYPNEDQDMESKDEPIQVNEPSLTVEKTEILEASNLDNEKSKLMCDIELCNVKVTEVEAENSSNRNDDISGAAEKLSFSPSVTGLTANQIPVYVATPTRTTTSDDKVQGTTPLISYTTSIRDGVSRDKIGCSLNGCSSEVSYAPKVSAKKSLNTARTLVGCTSDISSAPMKSVKVACDLNETYSTGEETINIKDSNEDEDMESKHQPIRVNEPSLTVEKAEILEASNHDDKKSKLMCDIELCNVKVTEFEAENSSNGNDDISDAAEKLSFSPSATGLTADQIPVYVAPPTRTNDKVQGTTPLISYTKKKAVTIPIISAGKSMNIAHAFVGCTSELSPAPTISAEKSMNNALVRCKTSLMWEETENIKDPNDQNMEIIDQPIEINEVVGFRSARNLEVKFINGDELSNLKGTEVETKYVDESFQMVKKAENLKDSNVEDGKIKLTCEVGFSDVKVTEAEEDSEEGGSNVNNDISDVLEKFSLSPSATAPVVNPIPVHVASPTRATASNNQVQETTSLISFIMKKAVTTPKGSIEVLDDMREINERGKCSASASKVVTELEAELKHSTGENSSHGKLNYTSIRQLKKIIKLTHSENKNAIVDQNKEIRPEEHENEGQNTLQRKVGFCDVKVTEVEEDSEEDGSNVNNDISDVLEKFSLSPSVTAPVVNPIPVHGASPTRATASENQVQETTPLISFITKKAVTIPKGSIEVLDDMRGINERGKCSSSTSKVVTESEAELKHSKGENSSQGKLNSTSIRQLKKMIKLTHSKNENAIVDQNKDIRPEENEKKGQNTLQRKLKATSLRQLKKTVKQLIQSDSENINARLNKKVVPEDHENKDQNTAQRELKATSARQLKKMIKQHTQTTKTPLPSLILAE